MGMKNKRPILPNAASKVETGRNLRLDRDQCDLLWRGVAQTIEEISRHADSVKKTPARSVRVKALRGALKAKSALAEYLSSDQGYLQALLERHALPLLGEALSGRGLALLGEVGSIPVSLRREDLTRYYDAQRGDASALYSMLDNAAAPVRALIAQDVGPCLALSLLELLAAPFEEQIRIEEANRGGRPQDLYRNYLIQELASLYQQIFGQQPTMTRTGRFTEFCEQIFQSVEMPVEGLERAVERVLTNRQAPSARQPSKKQRTPKPA